MSEAKLMNRAKYREEAEKGRLDGVVAASPNTVFYTTGALVLAQRKTAPNYSSRLIDDRPAYAVLDSLGTEVRLIVSEVEKSLAGEESWVEEVWAYREYREDPVGLLAEAIQELGLARGRVGIEKKYLRQSEVDRLVGLLPEAEFVESDSLWDRVRAVKTPGEIEILKRAANITEEAIYRAFRLARIGWTEKQLADTMIDNILALGADSLYLCIVGVGKNSLHAHNQPGSKRLERGEVVRIDFGGKFHGYGSDVARTAVVGRASGRQREVYGKLRRAQRRTIRQMKAGVRACDLYHVCRQAFADEGLELSMPHVGHSFSLGGHDNPMLQPGEEAVLEADMVFYVEPLYIDGDQGGYHVEDLVLVTEGEPEILVDYSSTEQMFTIDWRY